MSTRRPRPTVQSNALPALGAVLALGVIVEGCLPEAQAQTPPAHDAGVPPDAPRAHRSQSTARPPHRPMHRAGGGPGLSGYRAPF